MAPPRPRKNPNLYSYHLCFLLLVSTATLSAALSTSYSSVCPSLTPAQDSHTDGDDAISLTRSFQITTGHFSGGDGGLFSDDDDYNYRSFSLFPHGASRTNDKDLVHLTATLTLTGPRNSSYRSRGRRHSYGVTESISFVLDGYYSSTSLELCMVGAGAEFAADGSLKRYPDVALRLRVPSPPSLVDPFLTGRLEGSADIGTIHLLAYAEGDDYKYGSERPTCSPPTQAARGSLQVLGHNSACAHLKEQLMTSYRLEHGSAPVRRMHVNQMQCTVDGAVRAYMVFSNGTGESTQRGGYYNRQRRFLVNEVAAVADGQWDSDRGVLCLRACPVVRTAAPSALAVREHECGISMSFWFPAVWTLRDRSIVAGILWNFTQETAANNDDASGAISASSIDVTDDHRSNFTDMKYNYNDTMLEEARRHYLKIKKEKIKVPHSFPGNHTYRDFEFGYHGRDVASGESYPVTIGSVMVYGDRLAAHDSFSHHAVVVDTKHDDLLSVSYDIHHHAPPDDWVAPKNGSYSVTLQERRISAEGVYDPKRGLMSMIGCREHNGSTDCRVLVTVQFASLEARGQGHGRGVISSLRDNTDRLFFDKIDIHLYGMYSDQVSEAITRMDLESIMLVASTTLSCIFTVLQILHTKKNPEAARATSITMLVVLTLGYLTPLVLNFEALFLSRRSRYFAYSTLETLEMKEVMMRVPTMIAFMLQLRLLQLAWSGRRKSVDQITPSPVASERIVLQICLPLYMLGAVLAAIVHVINVRAANQHPLVVRIGREAPTIWADLVSYAGLILDGFLLPQVVLNASLAGSGVQATSPWFYIGCTMIRMMPHLYDVVRSQIYEPSINPSDLYANPRGDLFGVAWDFVIPCGAALLALLLFLQQRLGGSTSLASQRRRSGGYELASTNL